MAIIARAKGSSMDPIPEGVYTAVCVWIIDMGDQYSDYYKKSSRKVMLTWEIPDETVEIDGESKPRVLSKEYTLSLSDKAVLRSHLEAWRGKKFSETELDSFDLKNVLCASCQLQVLHNDKGYANVGSIMALPKGMPKLQPQNETIYFDLSDPECLELLDKLPSWVQDRIKKSSTYKDLVEGRIGPSGDFQEVDDLGDLPFN